MMTMQSGFFSPPLTANHIATVNVVDDDVDFLTALTRILEAAGFTAASFNSPGEFLRTSNPEQPGCLVADVCLPQMDGLELQRALAQRGSRIPVIFMTGFGDVSTAVKAFKEGALDFLEKPFSEKTFIDAVRAALQKDARKRAAEIDREHVLRRLERLTPRERQVLSFVVADQSAKEIARHLHISPRTVEHHREHAMAKMQAHSQHDLLVMAVIGGIYQPHL